MEPTATETSTDPQATNGKPPETFEVIRPADGSLIREVPVDGPERVAEVVARVRAAQPAWEALGFDGRRMWLERLRDWLLEQRRRAHGPHAGGVRQGRAPTPRSRSPTSAT